MTFLISKPADFVPFRQAFMYQHKNAHMSAHIIQKKTITVGTDFLR